jgi:hypothetical protein
MNRAKIKRQPSAKTSNACSSQMVTRRSYFPAMTFVTAPPKSVI